MRNGDNTPSKQLGLPKGSCSNLNTNIILKINAPTLIMMPRESKLLQAETVMRGWTNGDADALFKEAVRLSMNEQKVAYGVAIPEIEVETYLVQNLIGKATDAEGKMEALGEQYWIVTCN